VGVQLSHAYPSFGQGDLQVVTFPVVEPIDGELDIEASGQDDQSEVVVKGIGHRLETPSAV
jgi:hypothetical protein